MQWHGAIDLKPYPCKPSFACVFKFRVGHSSKCLGHPPINKSALNTLCLLKHMPTDKTFGVASRNQVAPIPDVNQPTLLRRIQMAARPSSPNACSAKLDGSGTWLSVTPSSNANGGTPLGVPVARKDNVSVVWVAM